MNIDYELQLAKLLATPDPETLSLPKLALVIGHFCRDWEPGDISAPGGDDMTSSEIACALEDMAQLSVNDVAVTMSWLGFEMAPTELNGHAWCMRRRRVYTGDARSTGSPEN